MKNRVAAYHVLNTLRLHHIKSHFMHSLILSKTFLIFLLILNLLNNFVSLTFISLHMHILYICMMHMYILNTGARYLWIWQINKNIYDTFKIWRFHQSYLYLTYLEQNGPSKDLERVRTCSKRRRAKGLVELEGDLHPRERDLQAYWLLEAKRENEVRWW